MRRAVSPLLLAIGLSACRADKQPDREPPFAGLALDLTPDPARRAVTVEVRLDADRAASVTALSVARSWADTRGVDAIDDLEARDAEGPIPAKARADGSGPDQLFDLARAPRGGLAVRYKARTGPSHFAARVGPDRMSGVGHAFLLLPRIEGAFPARIRVHVEALGNGADAASSFGFGPEVTARATTEDLVHAAYVAGRLWVEEPEPDAGAVETGKRLVIAGNPPFDGRAAWRFAMKTLSATDHLFGDPPDPGDPFTFFFVPEPGLGRAQDGAYLTRSLGLWFDPRGGMSADLQITLAHELTHRTLGGLVRLTEPDGRDAAWFSEGFTVHFARQAILQEGLLPPAAVLPDIRRSLGEPPPGEERAPADYRRGALWAAYFDAALREASGGTRSLADVVKELVARARKEGNPRLPASALREILARDLGPQGGEDFDRLAERHEAMPDLPEGAFGPCFRRLSRQEAVFELGFEGLRGTGGRVHAVVPGSAAQKAGLREGMVVQWSRVPRAEEALRGAEVELKVGEGRRPRVIKYRPVGKRAAVRWEAGSCG